MDNMNRCKKCGKEIAEGKLCKACAVEKNIINDKKPPVFSTKTGGFGPSGETRLHFPKGKKIEGFDG